MLNKFKSFFVMIKIEHTVFALPFAYLGYIVGSRGEWVLSEMIMITLILFFARTMGMCLNRIVDRRIDSKNPRTKSRALVTGELSLKFAWTMTVICFLAFIYLVFQLPPICVQLLPVVVFLLVIYHYLKRFTPLCHYGIGAVLACAPMGAWLVASKTWEIGVAAIGLAVFFWVGGMDIIYSLQDEASDRENGLFSIPSRWGKAWALRISFVSHNITIICLAFLGAGMDFGVLYWIGFAMAAGLLIGEQFLIRWDEKRFANASFLTANGMLSMVFLTTTWLSMGL